MSVICVLAILSKLIGCGLGLHAISTAMYSVVLLMSIVTTLFAPPVLWLTLQRPAKKTE